MCIDFLIDIVTRSHLGKGDRGIGAGNLSDILEYVPESNVFSERISTFFRNL